jgi:DNA-binding MarR family transcriptional regulator
MSEPAGRPRDPNGNGLWIPVPDYLRRDIWRRALRGEFDPRKGPENAYFLLALAHTLADFGERDGTRNYPSQPTLADALRCDKRTVGRGLEWLREAGWIWRRARRSHGRGDHYWLTLPPEAFERARVWVLPILARLADEEARVEEAAIEEAHANDPNW